MQTQKTALGLGGALGGPVTAFLYDWNMLPIGQQLWLKELMSYATYPAAAGSRDLQPQWNPGAGQESGGQSPERLALDVTRLGGRSQGSARTSNAEAESQRTEI